MHCTGPTLSPWRLRLNLSLFLLTVLVIIQVVHEHLPVPGEALVVLETHSFLSPLDQLDKDLVMSGGGCTEEVVLCVCVCVCVCVRKTIK